MNQKDFFSSLFWMMVGAGVCWGGYKLDLGTLHDPGSGFMFFWIGLIMIGLSLSISFRSLRERIEGGEIGKLWSGTGWKKAIYVLLALVFYAYAFQILGFIVTTALLLIFLFKVVEPQRWIIAIAGAVLSTLITYGVFQGWLGSQLPKGVLGIG